MAEGLEVVNGEAVTFDTPPEAIQMVAAKYPREALEAEAEGTVHVLTTVGASGLVTNAEVYESNAILHLEHAALEAAREWIFKPATQDGEPVKVRIIIPFRFRM